MYFYKFKIYIYIIIITYLPFHGFQLSDFKQFETVVQ